MRRPATLLAVLAGTALVACGGDESVAVPDGRASTSDGTTTTIMAQLPPVTTSTTVPPLAVAERVFDALATRDASTIAGVLDATAPGSPAAVFVEHQARVAALLDEYATPVRAPTSTTVAATGGESDSASSTVPAVPLVTAPDGVGSVCATAFDCTVFAEPEFDASGLLRSFSIDGVPVGDLVRSAGPVIDAEAVQMRVVSAYRTASERVSVLVEVVNGAETAVSPFAFAAVHRHRTVADGSAGVVEAQGAWGPTTVESGASTRHLVVFGSGPVDGDVLMNAVTADGLDLVFVLPLIAP